MMLDRRDFVLRDDVIFLNHGSFGACPRVILDHQRTWIDRLEQQPVLYFREIMHLMQHARMTLAEYFGTRRENLVYVANATYGVSLAAQAFGQMLQVGDEILTTDHEYGACDRAWNRYAVEKGAKVVRASVPMPAPSQNDIVELIWRLVTPRTRLLFISHITSPTGLRMPVEELCRRCREAGIITVIDGSHVPGHLPLNLSELDADFYTGNCHKWMCTPKGSAFMWTSDTYRDVLPPLVVSWGAQIPTVGDGPFVDENEFLGTRDHSPFLSIPFALEWMHSHNWEAVQARCRALTCQGVDMLCVIDGIRSIREEGADPLLQLGTVLLPRNVDVLAMKTWLYDERHIEVVVHRWLDTPMLRFSVHAHTSKADIELLATAVREYLVSLPS
ncbi:MAG: aminotransferase class V-fold PLP-dependent enzyme [Candidatus Kapaibacterium sp.]